MEYIPAKHIVIRNKSTDWFGMDYTMNIYRGCCHGCVYCDSRSDCYQVDRFGTVRAKENALALIRDELERKLRPGVVATGSMSDPYNPYEEELKLTRGALQIAADCGFGVGIATKSDLIVRDIDVLSALQAYAPVLCKLTVTTTDDGLAAMVEPNAPSPSRRLEAVRALSQAGLFTGVLLTPVLPFVEDSEENVLAVVDAAADAGAKFVYALMGMTMRPGQRRYYLEALERLFPGQGLTERYLRRYGDRYECASPWAVRLWEVFTARCRERGLLYSMKEIVSAYRKPWAGQQLSLF